MNTELYKRLEEAANDFADKHGFRVPYDGSNDFYDETDVKASKDGFLTGAEHGYKEAIKQAKGWLKEHLNYVPMDAFLDAFESDMSKLWEEKK